jgi:hypothetical protein
VETNWPCFCGIRLTRVETDCVTVSAFEAKGMIQMSLSRLDKVCGWVQDLTMVMLWIYCDSESKPLLIHFGIELTMQFTTRSRIDCRSDRATSLIMAAGRLKVDTWSNVIVDFCTC